MGKLKYETKEDNANKTRAIRGKYRLGDLQNITKPYGTPYKKRT